MPQMLRNLGALPLALAAILALVWLMQALISARTEKTEQSLPGPSVVYLIEAAATDTEALQPVAEPPPPPESEPEPPEPPEPLEAEPLPEPLDLALDPQPLELPAVETPPKPKPKPKPRAKPKVQPKPVSQPRRPNPPAAASKLAAPKPAAPAKFDRRPISAPRPKYPANAKRRRIEGYVTVRFTVTREGRVSNPRVIAAHPPGMFEREALAAIRRWRFRRQPDDFPGVTQKIRFDLRH